MTPPSVAAQPDRRGGDPSPPVRRVAWFTPLPPSTSGIAAYSAEILPRLRASGLVVDAFVDAVADLPAGACAARDFVWKHRRDPYDLTVYQMGNAACHDYMWGYLFHAPGLVVLHDAQLHQARARALLTRWQPRLDDYLSEFAWNHPAAPPDIARLVASGLGGALYGLWPHVRLVLQRARLAAVHSAGLAAQLAETYGVEVRTVPMGVADPRAAAGPLEAAGIRARYGLPADAIVVAAVGGLTPEKRLPLILRTVAALAADHPRLHLLLVGAPAAHYDIHEDIAREGIGARVHVTGYVADDELPACLQAADLCLCLRWPSGGETSASWLRAMAAGRATIVTDLLHQADLPVYDPRTWQASSAAAPVAVGIPILDESTALAAAIDGLARHATLRDALGRAARAHWEAHHTLEAMTASYLGLLADAAARPIVPIALPAHLAATGGERVPELLAPFRLPAPDLPGR